MTRFLKEHWKPLAVVLALIVGLSFAAIRMHRFFFSDPMPDWVELTENHSASIPKNPRQQFQALWQAATAEAEKRNQSIGAIRFLELGADAQDSVLWTAEQIVNGGFQPLRDFERSADIPRADLLGYYTIAGDPLRFRTRSNPNYPNSIPVTLHLDKPLAPGAAQLIVRREHSSIELRAESNREFQLTLPPSGGGRRLAGSLQIRAVYLGTDAALTGYTPQKNALVAADGSACVGWIEPAGPAIVTFTRQ